MQGAIGLGAKANGLEYALLATSWILSQMIVMVYVWSQKAIHAFHSTHISIVANQVYTLVLLHSVQTTKMAIVADQVHTLVLTDNENDYSSLLVCSNHVWTWNLILMPTP